MKRTTVGKWIARWTAIGLIIFNLLALYVPSFGIKNIFSKAEESSSRVLRVAFAQVTGITEKDEDGKRHGLVVDYLNEIAKYTHWEYEYIDTTGEEMLDEFAQGKYELMGGNYYMPALEEYYAYPNYNMGYSKAILFAREDDDSIRGYDLRSLNGKTIGVYERATENIRRLKEYLSINDIDCTLKYYSYDQLSDDGNLYEHLENKEVDLLLGNSLEKKKNFRVVVSYNSQPYYIVTNVGNQEILDGLNMAMAKIIDSNPNFAEERYAANFSDASIVDIRLNEEEREYVRQKGSVTVAVPRSFHPFSCRETDDMHDGLIYDMMKVICDFTGLNASYEYVDSYVDAVRAVQQGKADVLAFYLGKEETSENQGLVLTSPYVSMNYIVMRNKKSSVPGEGLVEAVIEGRELSSGIEVVKRYTYRSPKEALAAVNRGEADFVYGVATHLEREIQWSHFANVVPATLVNDHTDISFALARPADPDLLTVFNKAINSLSAQQKSDLLDKNIISVGTGRLSLTELIYANPVMFIGIFSLILLLAVVAILWISRTKVKSAVMRSNLEKARAESRAKGEFLSRMSHELRTPMNAVVGLAELAGMKEGVPDNVRELLSKLRISSHYLLDLINDILDMSRLDSGMLTIAAESFSLDKMLGELQLMMETDAKKRGLDYKMEKDIVHGGVIGDAVRLRQVLTNLLSNAFKFTPAGGRVVLRVTEESFDGEKAAFSFRVIDSGSGISPADQKRIFDTFEQVGTNYAKSQGTGLGLPISRSIVQLMGGQLDVESELGRGSEFYFTVSLSLGTPADDAREPTAAPAEKKLLEGIRILLAEDNDLNAEIAIQLLELQGASVWRSENGKKAVERFAESKSKEIQAILMDIQMPEMNGLEATRAIRALARPDAATVPIVAMTANVFKEDVDAAMAAGMNGFAGKPLDVAHLYRLLYDLLNKGAEN